MWLSASEARNGQAVAQIAAEVLTKTAHFLTASECLPKHIASAVYQSAGVEYVAISGQARKINNQTLHVLRNGVKNKSPITNNAKQNQKPHYLTYEMKTNGLYITRLCLIARRRKAIG